MTRRTDTNLGRLGLIALLMIATLLVMAAPASAGVTYAAQENDFVAKINAERRSRGLRPLTVNLQLTGVARNWSSVMERENRMYHNPRMSSQVKGSWTRLGENVGYTVKTGAPLNELVKRLHVAFMNSPGHKANVLGDFNQIGIGVRIARSGKLWVTVNFLKDRRVVSNGTVGEASRMANRVFGGRRAQYAVVTASNAPAYAMGAAALAGSKAPLLYTHPRNSVTPDPVLHPTSRATLDRALRGKGTVFLVGGRAQVSTRASRELAADGYTVRRLNGRSLEATMAAVARATVRRHGNNGKVVLVNRSDWGSGVSGAMWAAHSGTPVLATSRGTLHPATREFLRTYQPAKRYAIGSADALSGSVVRAAGASRIGGRSRPAVSVNVARRLWGRRVGRDGDRWTPSPGANRRGWAYTLAHAPWSATYGGPSLLVGKTSVPTSVDRYLSDLRYGGDVSGRVQAPKPVARNVVNRVQRLVAAP